MRLFGNAPKENRFPVEPLTCAADDPFATEYVLTVKLAEETKKTGWQYGDINLDFTEAGQEILKLDLEGQARLLLVLVAQAAHYDVLARKAKSLAKTDMDRMNPHMSCPEWESIWPTRMIWAQTVRHLMRRKLPLGSEHLTRLAEWIEADDEARDWPFPIKAFVKAIEASPEIVKQDAGLRSTLSRLASNLRGSQYHDMPKLGQRLEDLLDVGRVAESDAADQVKRKAFDGPDPSKPAFAGSPNVLVRLKQYLGILPGDEVAGMMVGFDQFMLRSDSALSEEHEVINILLTEFVGTSGYFGPDFNRTVAGRAMLENDAKRRGRILLAAAERSADAAFPIAGAEADLQFWQSRHMVISVFLAVLESKPALDRDGLFDVLLYLSAIGEHMWKSCLDEIGGMIEKVEEMTKASPLTSGERHVLHRLRSQSVRVCPLGRPPPEVERLSKLIGDGLYLALAPGEAWADALNADLGKLPAGTRKEWAALVEHATTATGSRPSAKWLKVAKQCREAIGETKYCEAVQRWFPLLNVSRTVRMLPGGTTFGGKLDGTISEDNATCLRGLLWILPEKVSADVIRAVGALAASCYRKLPGIGARAAKAGNAGVFVLSRISDPLAVGQLALLKVKVKLAPAQKEIEKAFAAAAERAGLPRAELEEMSVPSYGLTEVGICREQMGEYTAHLTVVGTNSTELQWVKSDGKVQKSVPASVKESHKEDLKELQLAAKDIQRMLPAQRERIDRLFLQQMEWQYAAWAERYLNHPLVGTLARRIIWEFKRDEKIVSGIWHHGRIVDVNLQTVEVADGQTTVRLWHPIGKSTEEVVAWRSWLEEQQIQQPFKQAHREVYLLTDAERNTRTYSNRYAAHVLKQHQFNALCSARGWKNQLRLMVDASYAPPLLHLPSWGFRAEYWVEGIGADYGSDTNDSGVYNHVATDQVRFYRVNAEQRMAHAGGGGYQPYGGNDAEPVPLEEIPPLVFSEVMRDVDLFVGVASVGNDPVWQDGGPQGRYVDYWRDYAFGELNASATTRKDVLQRLIPKLKIASRCSFSDKFLVVRGSIRTYKIHLGSGNIMMEPNDQYLCIVPRQGEVDTGGNVPLPFEGDRTLSIIISKAFMLADDQKIKDPTILSQIRR